MIINRLVEFRKKKKKTKTLEETEYVKFLAPRFLPCMQCAPPLNFFHPNFTKTTPIPLCTCMHGQWQRYNNCSSPFNLWRKFEK